MENIIRLTIAKILQKVSDSEYLVKDIFSTKKYSMCLTGNQSLNYRNLPVGDEIYVRYATLSGGQCRMTTVTDMKMDESRRLIKLKDEVDKKRIELGL